MYRFLLLIALLPVGSLDVAAIGQTQNPALPPAAKENQATQENIEAALRLTLAAAAEYEIRVGKDEKEKKLDLQREPVLKWSNPDRGEIHGNVFLWTREGRPLAVGCLFKWFSPFTHMSHEFQSLAEEPLIAKFHGNQVWETSEPGLRFEEIPNAPAPAANEAQRLLQLKQLAKDFSGKKTERDETKDVELRLLTQPIHRYAAPKQDVIAGGLFALVHGTDPEIFLLIEARGKDPATARWQYAATRMTSVAVLLRYKDKQVWSSEVVPWKDVYDHKHAYTSFMFKEIPDFLKEAAARLKP